MIDNKHCKIYSFNDVDAPEGNQKNNGGMDGTPIVDPLKLQKVLSDNFDSIYNTQRDHIEKITNFEEILQGLFVQLNFINKLLIDHKLETIESLRNKYIEYLAEIGEHSIKVEEEDELLDSDHPEIVDIINLGDIKPKDDSKQ